MFLFRTPEPELADCGNQSKLAQPFMKTQLLTGVENHSGLAQLFASGLAVIILAATGCSRSPSETASVPDAAQNPTTTPTNKPETKVIFNGRELTATQLEELEKRYRTKAHSGNYWYDTKSGLFGVVGQAAAGFMYPGHDLGPLAADASKGNTGVFINGREQTAQEVLILSYLARTQVLPGRYWLDGIGNAGYEGNPTPVGNLFAAALIAQQQGGGGGGGGDNFWNTRFSAGNYNSDNTAGYVSLPGGGFSSYGL